MEEINSIPEFPPPEVKSAPTPTPFSGKSRITVVETVAFTGPEAGVQAVDSRFNRALKSDEQPYLRPGWTVGEAWIPLDHGWLERASMIVLKNTPPKGWGNPTPEEAAARAAAVLEIGVVPAPVSARSAPGYNGYVYPFALVYPDESNRLTPAVPLDMLWVRCRKGSTKVTLNLYPE